MGAVLYSFRRCPYAMRGRMALHASGLEFEHREIILRDKPAAMLTASPKGTVPVFITEDGQVIEESLDLMHYALGRSDPHNWLGVHPERTAQLITDNDGPFKQHLDRYKYASRYEADAKRGAVNHEHRETAETYLDALDAQLGDKPYLFGQKQSLADVAIFPFIRQFSNVEPEWWAATPYQSLRGWLTRQLDSRLFLAIMLKHPLWQEDSSSLNP